MQSFPALLDTEPLYELPRVPVLAAFDHVINYIPELNVFLDSNGGSAAFGVLPLPDLDKPVVLLGADAAGLRTPSAKPSENRTTIETRITIKPDGRASGEDSLHSTGSTGLAYEAWAETLAGQDPVRVAREMLLGAQLTGEGTAVVEPFTAEQGFGISLLYELRNYAETGRDSGLRVIPPLDMLQSYARASVTETGTPHAPYTCNARSEAETIIVTFPPSTRITLPHPMVAAATDRLYHSSYKLDAPNIVHVEREYRSTLPRGYCQPADIVQSRLVQEQVLTDLRSEIRYTLPGK
jgi:hypothetical protein